jgi:hypothetical protein
MAKRWIGLALVVGLLAAASAVEGQAPSPPGQNPPPAPYPGSGGVAFGSLPPMTTPAVPGGAPDQAQLPGGPGLPQPPDPGCGPGCEPCPPPPPPCEPATGFWPECCPGGHFNADFDYLLWWFKKRSQPPLVTAGAFNDSVPAALGQPHTTILLGNSSVDTGATSGVRVRLAYYFDKEETCGVEANGFYMEQRSALNTFSSNGANGTPVLARPFFNVNAGVEDADPIAVPNIQSGTLTILQPRRFWGGDTNLVLGQDPSLYSKAQWSLLLGARYVSLDEKLVASEWLTDLPGLGIQGNNTFLRDNFTDYNRFYGGQIGLGYDYRLGPVFLAVVGKIAFGVNDQVWRASAITSITEPSGLVTTSTNRGLLVQPSNAGSIRRSVFSYVPETTVNLGYHFNDCVNMSIGYNFLFWYRVLRPTDQIDRAVNIQALQPFDEVGPARPEAHVQNANFWAQGLTATIGFSF